MLQISDLAYGIEPIRFSATFEYLVYKIDSDDIQLPPMRCGLTEEKIARQLELREFYRSTDAKFLCGLVDSLAIS